MSLRRGLHTCIVLCAREKISKMCSGASTVLLHHTNTILNRMTYLALGHCTELKEDHLSLPATLRGAVCNPARAMLYILHRWAISLHAVLNVRSSTNFKQALHTGALHHQNTRCNTNHRHIYTRSTYDTTPKLQSCILLHMLRLTCCAHLLLLLLCCVMTFG